MTMDTLSSSFAPPPVPNTDLPFDRYVVPIASTDYTGLEKIDPRLADREWRLENLYWVVNEDGKLVRFKLREAQRELMRNMHNRNIILKARQLGFTTFICIFMLDYALFNRNKQLGIIAQTQADATVIFRKVKVAWDNFPQAIKEFLHLNTEGDSAIEYRFTNGSGLRISTSLRSGTYQMVLITEFGKISAHFPEKASEIVTGTLPAVPTNGVVFIESTAEGEGGHFHEFVQDARQTASERRPLSVKEYKFFFYPWWQNPADTVDPTGIEIRPDVKEYLDKKERQLKIKFTDAQRAWYALEVKVQKEKMKREHPTDPDEAFFVSGNKLFDSESIDRQLEKYAREPVDVRNGLQIFREYHRGHTYGLGADVSLGVGRDSSTAAIVDFDNGEVVATYRSSTIDPVLFAHEIKRFALEYGGCIAAPEANSVGATTCVTLNNIYPYIYTQVREGMLETVQTSKLGWLTTPGNKPRMMYQLAEAIEQEDLKVLDKVILMEARAFNKEDSLDVTVSAATTRHFDLLIACAIAWQMRAYAARGKADPQQVAAVEERRAQRARGTHSYR